MKKIIWGLAIVIVVIIGVLLYRGYKQSEWERNGSLVSGNGRLEATEISIAAKLAGRVEKVMVEEGDFVQKDQKLVQMQVNVLNAQLAQAKAKKKQATTDAASARAIIKVRQSELEGAKATVLRFQSSLRGAKSRYERTKALSATNATSKQHLETDETHYLGVKAELAGAEAMVKQREAEILAAKADADSKDAAIVAAQADIDRIQADIDDSLLISPRKGRIQYRIAEDGEVLSAGGRVLNLVDLTDVYMTFFLPEGIAGKVKLGSEVRIVLDAIPQVAIPAKVSYVASVAQFTPKTVETKTEREKLMFRIKARINQNLLNKYIEYVKTGIPGVAYVKLRSEAPWPKFLQNSKLPQK